MVPKKQGFHAELAKAFEANPAVREMLRARSTLLGWPKKESVGAPSLMALSMNSKVLTIMANLYFSRSQCSCVKAYPIAWLRVEYNKFRAMMSLPENLVSKHLDIWGMKLLFSLGLRRWGVQIGARSVAGCGICIAPSCLCFHNGGAHDIPFLSAQKEPIGSWG